MRIVIWGCGKYGEYIYSRIIIDSTSSFSVFGMGDIRHIELNEKIRSGEKIFTNEDMNQKYTCVYGYDDVKKAYDEDLIDGVIIGVYQIDSYRQVEEIISVLGIPIFALRNDAVFSETVASSKYLIYKNKITVYEINNVDVIISPLHNNYAVFTYLLHNDRILWESDRYMSHSKYDSNIPYSYKSELVDDMYVEEACSFLHIGNSSVYGHFVFDCLGKIMAMEDAGYEGIYLLYESSISEEWVDILCKYFDIPSKRFCLIDENQRLRIHVKKMHCIKSIVDASKINAKLIIDFADRIVDKLVKKDEISKYPERIYVKRTGNRQLLNGDDILRKYNFTVLIPEEMSILEQIRYFHHADVVFAPHGSNVTNLIFMRNHTFLIETFGAGFVDLFFMEAIKERNLRYRMLVAQNEYMNTFLSNYIIHPGLISSTIKEIIANQ